jgi:hypothetical protein
MAAQRSSMNKETQWTRSEEEEEEEEEVLQ